MMPPSADRRDSARRLLVIWDLPTRLFHWGLVLCIAALWWTGTQRMLDWHRLAGYGISVLLIFRFGWGLMGSGTARFVRFVHGPRAVVDYVRHHLLKRGPPAYFGHNPLGGWSVVAMLATLIVQVLLGMVSVDVDGIESGPFSYWVDFETGRTAAALHHLLFNVLLGLIALHLLAIFYHLLIKRDNLIGPMLTGKRWWVGPSADFPTVSWRKALLLLLIGSMTIWAIVSIYGHA